MNKIAKSTIYSLSIVLMIGCIAFLSNPFFWGMQNNLPKQPKFTSEERIFFKKFESEGEWFDIRRSYVNFDDMGEEIWHGVPIDTARPYIYIVTLSTFDRAVSYNLNEEYNLELANYIKDSLLNNSKYLRRIEVVWQYRDETDPLRNKETTYCFFYQRDSVNNKLIRIDDESKKYKDSAKGGDLSNEREFKF